MDHLKDQQTRTGNYYLTLSPMYTHDWGTFPFHVQFMVNKSIHQLLQLYISLVVFISSFRLMLVELVCFDFGQLNAGTFIQFNRD